MLGSIVTLLVLVALVILFAWLARRAWQAKRAWVKWVGVVLAGLLTLILTLVTVVGAMGLFKMYAPHNISMPTVTVQSSPTQIARGEHLAAVVCAGCHSANNELPLSGGNNLSADTGLPLGDLYGPNITPAGVIKSMSDQDIFRSVRTGIAKDGRPTMMAAVGTRLMSDEDLLAVIAYLRNSPSAQNKTPDFNPTFLLGLFAGAGLVPLDVPATVSAVTAPPKAATAEYGKYVIDVVGCADCHGPKLDGNAPPPNPPAPNLTVLLTKLSKDDFIKVVRARGSLPTSNTAMTWRTFAKLDDVELEALFLAMRRVVGK